MQKFETTHRLPHEDQTIMAHTQLHHTISLQIFLYCSKITNIVSITTSNPFNPTLTSLEEEKDALFIAKTETLAYRGHNFEG